MMGRAAPALEVSAEERGELERLIRTHATAQQIALRARMILLSAEGLKVGEIAARLDVWRKTVSQWRALALRRGQLGRGAGALERCPALRGAGKDQAGAGLRHRRPGLRDA